MWFECICEPLISCELQTLSADQKQKRFRKHFSMNQCASSPWFPPTIYSGPAAALTHCMIYHWEPALVCWVAAFMPGGTVVPTTTRRGPQRCTQIKPQHKLTLCAWKPRLLHNNRKTARENQESADELQERRRSVEQERICLLHLDSAPPSAFAQVFWAWMAVSLDLGAQRWGGK